MEVISTNLDIAKIPLRERLYSNLGNLIAQYFESEEVKREFELRKEELSNEIKRMKERRDLKNATK